MMLKTMALMGDKRRGNEPTPHQATTAAAAEYIWHDIQIKTEWEPENRGKQISGTDNMQNPILWADRGRNKKEKFYQIGMYHDSIHNNLPSLTQFCIFTLPNRMVRVEISLSFSGARHTVKNL
jgi:hypothetical protein